jgi:hypothetical protein
MTRAGRALARRGLEAFDFAPAKLIPLALEGRIMGHNRGETTILHHALDGHAADFQFTGHFRYGHQVALLS